MKKRLRWGRNSSIALLLLSSLSAAAQASDSNPVLPEVTLQSAIDYAIRYQPRIQQSLIDEEITNANIRSRLSDWYPQVNFNYNLQHNFILQTSIIGGNAIKFGVDNTSYGQFTLSQALFNRDVLLANKTKKDVRLQSRQTTESNKIDLVVNVTKAFYDVLATQQQIRVAEENIARNERSLRDATSQYQAGVTDKIDYKRATISLNNIRATKNGAVALLDAKVAYLKSLMGYPENEILAVVADSLAMENSIALDTLQQPDYTARVEYRQLETQRSLLRSSIQYNKQSFLPTASLIGAYNLNYQNNDFNKLYLNNFPNSYAAVTVGLPLFQGGKRWANIRAAKLQLSRSDEDVINIKNVVNQQYEQALATYKSSLENYSALKENVSIAKEVYDVVQLQYKSGIKTYLEVITAETDLRSAQINYFNALYQVLAGKTDVQKALGQITITTP
ncbi:MAG TPA: TolC family protein [Chitinophagaceae bacterium]|nr:TolC family protein [Chitinophagaceae bacterium]